MVGVVVVDDVAVVKDVDVGSVVVTDVEVVVDVVDDVAVLEVQPNTPARTKIDKIIIMIALPGKLLMVMRHPLNRY